MVRQNSAGKTFPNKNITYMYTDICREKVFWKDAAAQLFFPQRNCLLCGKPIDKPGLCQDCNNTRHKLKRCRYCASFLLPTSANEYCTACDSSNSGYIQARAALPYQGHFRDALLNFKYHGATWLRRPIAAIMLDTLIENYADINFDAIVPVPLSAGRNKKRGYNQSELLCEIISAKTGICHFPHLLQRVKETPPLAEYDRKQRIKLLNKAFYAYSAAKSKKILLVDDIFTTGTTVESCTQALHMAGAADVYVLTAAAKFNNVTFFR